MLTSMRNLVAAVAIVGIPPGWRALFALKTNSNKTFLTARPCFNDLGRRDTFRAMSQGFDLPIAPLQSQSTCAAERRGSLCRNPGSRRMRVKLDHGAAMANAEQRNQTTKHEAISTR